MQFKACFIERQLNYITVGKIRSLDPVADALPTTKPRNFFETDMKLTNQWILQYQRILRGHIEQIVWLSKSSVNCVMMIAFDKNFQIVKKK